MTNAAIVARARVLVVEDDAAARASYECALRRAGYDVVTVGTIAEASRSVRGRRPDIVVLGRRLPDGRGLHLLRRWRGTALMEKVPVVVLATSSSPDARQAARAGADAFVIEPCSADALTMYLGRILRGSGAGAMATAMAMTKPARYRMTSPAPRTLLYGTAIRRAMPALHQHEGGFHARCHQCLRGSPPLGRDATEAERRAVELGWSPRSNDSLANWQCPICIEREKTARPR